MDSDYEIIYYRTDVGYSPLEEFIKLLHGFSKKTRKVPEKEIEIAKMRMEKFLKKEGIKDV